MRKEVRIKRLQSCMGMVVEGALVMESIVFVIFLASLGGLLWPVLHTWHGELIVVGTAVLGLLLPLVLHAPLGLHPQRRTVIAAVLSLVGGFVLRYAVLTSPSELLARGPEIHRRYVVEGSEGIGTPGPVLLPGFSPEDGRPRGGGPGADPENKTANLEPRSKVFDGP